MAIKVTGLMHAGVRIGPSDEDIEKANDFYSGLLGLERDTGRPHIPTIPGFWVNVKDGARSTQIHVFGAEGMSKAARSPQQDPTRAHIAFAVQSLEEARAELARRGVDFWVYKSLVGAASDQVFFEDPFGNMIELQEAPAA